MEKRKIKEICYFIPQFVHSPIHTHFIHTFIYLLLFILSFTGLFSHLLIHSFTSVLQRSWLERTQKEFMEGSILEKSHSNGTIHPAVIKARDPSGYLTLGKGQTFWRSSPCKSVKHNKKNNNNRNMWFFK